MKKILLLEDDIVLLETLQEELEYDGYSVDVAKHGELVLEYTASSKYDLYIFDVNVPYIDGLTLIQELRESGDNTPLIFLTSKDQEIDKENGFEAGCDDYVCKPFSLTELKHRIKAVLKRTSLPESLQYGDVTINLEQNMLQIDKTSINIEYKTLQILHLFVSNPGKIFSIDRIIENVYDSNEPSYTVIRVHISKINSLFPAKRIHNIRGRGYKYETI